MSIAIIIGLTSLFKYKRNNPTPIIHVTQNQNLNQKEEQISIAEQAFLRKQLQMIVAGGKESDCVTLSDDRYKLVCYSIFGRISNNK